MERKGRVEVRGSKGECEVVVVVARGIARVARGSWRGKLQGGTDKPSRAY